MDVFKGVIKILSEFFKEECDNTKEDYNRYLTKKNSSQSENEIHYYSTFVNNTKKYLDDSNASLAKLTNIDNNTLNLSLREDLGIDSLDFIQIAMNLEEEFNIMFPNSVDELDSFVYLKDIVNYIENKLK